MENSSSCRDNKSTANEKSRRLRQLDKELVQHFRQEGSGHPEYTESELFPSNGRFIWDSSAKAYADTTEDVIDLSSDQIEFVDNLNSMSAETGVERHFVGTTGISQRKNRPPNIQVGHFVVCRGHEDDYYPWYIGEVIDILSDGDKDQIKILEFGTGSKVHVLGHKIDPTKVRWQARFSGEEWIGSGINRRQVLHSF